MAEQKIHRTVEKMSTNEDDYHGVAKQGNKNCQHGEQEEVPGSLSDLKQVPENKITP